jgi:peptidoglycan biosynthesis protein MviN/MurJ (putative lipid II flippase)
VVNVVLNFLMVPLFPYQKGYLACSWANVITEVFLLVAGYVLVRRQLGPLPWVRSLIPIIVSGGLMVGVMGVLSSENVFWVVPVAGILYLGSLWLTGGVTPEELRMARQSLRRRLAPEVEGIDVG